MSVTVDKLISDLQDVSDDGYGQAQVIIEEQGLGYVGELLYVDTLLIRDAKATLTLLSSTPPHDDDDVRAHLDAICKEAGLHVMREVMEVVLDREPGAEVLLRILMLTPQDITDFYEIHIGPEIDRLVSHLAWERN